MNFRFQISNFRLAILLWLAGTLALPSTRAAAGFGGVMFAGRTSPGYDGSQFSDTITLTAGAAVGDYVFITAANEQAYSGPNPKPITGITDSKSHTGTFGGENHISSVHTGELWYYKVTTALSAGDTITVSFTGNQSSTRNYVVFNGTGIVGSSPVDVSVYALSTGNNTTIDTTLTTVADGDFVAGCVVFQGDHSISLLNGTAIGSSVLALGGSVGIRVQPFYTVKTTHGSFGPGGTLSTGENVIVLMIALKPAGADWYVDFSGGSDGNTGVDTTHAWKHCPGDTNATSTASAHTVVPGDRFFFKGGVAYTGDITVKSSGSSGLAITYDGNSAGTWGTGKAQLDLNATYYHAFNCTASAKDNITIKNFDVINAKNMRNTTGAIVNRAGSDQTVNYLGNNDTDSEGVVYVKGGKNWWIEACDFHDWENAYDRGVLGAESSGDPNKISSNPVLKAAVLFYGAAHGGTVTNCGFWAIGEACIKNFGATNFAYMNNNFGGSDAITNKGWLAVAIKLSDLSGIGAAYGLIKGNRFHDCWQYQGDESQQRSHSGDTIHIFGGKSNSGSFVSLSATDCVHDVTIDGNFFYNNYVFQYFNGTAWSLMESGWYNITWQRNLFINGFSGDIEFRDGDNIYFLANSFLDTTNTTCLNPKAGSTVYNPTNVFGRNNIFATLSPNSANTPCGTSSGYTNTFYPDFDYNIYYSPNNGGNTWAWNGSNKDLAAWRTLSGADAHSQYGSPALVNWAAAASSSGGDFHPTSSSIAKNGGTSLSSYFTTDYDGNVISTWPVGALLSSAGGGGGGAVASTMSGGVRLGGGVRME